MYYDKWYIWKLAWKKVLDPMLNIDIQEASCQFYQDFMSMVCKH